MHAGSKLASMQLRLHKVTCAHLAPCTHLCVYTRVHPMRNAGKPRRALGTRPEVAQVASCRVAERKGRGVSFGQGTGSPGCSPRLTPRSLLVPGSDSTPRVMSLPEGQRVNHPHPAQQPAGREQKPPFWGLFVRRNLREGDQPHGAPTHQQPLSSPRVTHTADPELPSAGPATPDTPRAPPGHLLHPREGGAPRQAPPLPCSTHCSLPAFL